MAGSSRNRLNSMLKVWLLSKFESSDMLILAHDMLIPGSDPTGKVNSTGSVDMTSTPISAQIEGQLHAVLVSPRQNTIQQLTQTSFYKLVLK